MGRPYIVRFKFFDGKQKYYSTYLMNYDEFSNKPLLKDRKILFFSRLSKMKQYVLEQCGQEAVQELFITYDPTYAINCLKEMNNQVEIINLAMAFDDYLQALGIKTPVGISSKALTEYFIFATVDSDIKSFFEIKKRIIKPQHLINYFNWATGIIINNSIVIK